MSYEAKLLFWRKVTCHKATELGKTIFCPHCEKEITFHLIRDAEKELDEKKPQIIIQFGEEWYLIE